MQYLFSVDNSLRSFLGNLICLYNEKRQPHIKDKVIDFLELLCEIGFDYYSMLVYFSQMEDISEKDIERFLHLSPQSRKALSLSTTDIHGAIPRWTGSKYHTAPIADVIVDVRNRILSKETGIYLYNSNLNTRNRKSLNDLYVLAVSSTTIRWFDINRMINYEFINQGEE